MESTQEILSSLRERVSSIESKVEVIPELKERFEKYVTLERFKPIEYIVFGLVGGILLSVLGALLAAAINTRHMDASSASIQKVETHRSITSYIA